MTNQNKLCAIGVATLLATVSQSNATILYDFEDAALGNTGLNSIFTQGGINMYIELDENILRVVEADLHIAGWGSQSLILGGGSQRSPMRLSFERSIESFSIEFGDYFGTKPDNVHISLYSGVSGTGELVYEENIISLSPIDEGFVDSFSFSASGLSDMFSSVVIETSGSFGNPSLYFDNISVTVPTPSTLLAFAGLSILGTRRSRS